MCVHACVRVRVHICVHVVDRNYHVFYYLLAGCTETERETLLLSKPHDYFYLNQVCLSCNASFIALYCLLI